MEHTDEPKDAVVQPRRKRGGLLAFVGFMILVGGVAVGVIAFPNDRDGRDTLTFVGAGVGAVYIIINLLRWMFKREAVRGAGIAWTVAALLLLAVYGKLVELLGL